jgi:hypothetical protein
MRNVKYKYIERRIIIIIIIIIIQFSSILVYIRGHLPAQRSITKLARVRRKTQNN